jgi:hypothetical protein
VAFHFRYSHVFQSGVIDIVHDCTPNITFDQSPFHLYALRMCEVVHIADKDMKWADLTQTCCLGASG